MASVVVSRLVNKLSFEEESLTAVANLSQDLIGRHCRRGVTVPIQMAMAVRRLKGLALGQAVQSDCQYNLDFPQRYDEE